MEFARAEHSGLFRMAQIDALVEAHLERRANLGYHLWGLVILFHWDEKMENSNGSAGGAGAAPEDGKRLRFYWIVVLFAAAVYAGCMLSPPSLMDDVDAVQAQIARNMLHSGDWVTARLDGIPYFEKAPLIYWLIATCFKLFGAYDWVARIPVVLAAIALAWVTAAFGMWAFGRRAGFYAGLCISTCIGLFLFTRILIPDVMLTANIALSMWAFLRAIEEEEPHGRRWAAVLAVSLGVSLLWKSLIGVVFPVGAAIVYLALTRQLWQRKVWKRLHPLSGLGMILLIAAPWHILATLRNPPYFDFTMHSTPGEYHGFLWFYFINEQLLRFLNLRYPRDYDTVPRWLFWSLHLLWLFPWSVYLPAVCKLNFRPLDRGGRTRLLALCLTGFVLDILHVFHHAGVLFDALLSGAGAAAGLGHGGGRRLGSWRHSPVERDSGGAGIAALVIFIGARNLPTPGDISNALTHNPGAYKLSLGHIEDLNFASFAYLRTPLLLAASRSWRGPRERFAPWASGLFSPPRYGRYYFFRPRAWPWWLSTRICPRGRWPRRCSHSPPGKLIVDHNYYAFSSIFFYTDRAALLLDGRVQNLIYGSYAPGAPGVFIDDRQWKDLWLSPQRYYLVASLTAVPLLEDWWDMTNWLVLAASGGKLLLSNRASVE